MKGTRADVLYQPHIYLLRKHCLEVATDEVTAHDVANMAFQVKRRGSSRSAFRTPDSKLAVRAAHDIQLSVRRNVHSIYLLPSLSSDRPKGTKLSLTPLSMRPPWTLFGSFTEVLGRLAVEMKKLDCPQKSTSYVCHRAFGLKFRLHRH